MGILEWIGSWKVELLYTKPDLLLDYSALSLRIVLSFIEYSFPQVSGFFGMPKSETS